MSVIVVLDQKPAQLQQLPVTTVRDHAKSTLSAQNEAQKESFTSGSEKYEELRKVELASLNVVTMAGGPPPSRVQCLGENFLQYAARYRSCHMQNLCYDTVAKEFVLFPTDRHQRLVRRLENTSNAYFSSVIAPMIASAENEEGLALEQGRWTPSMRSQVNVTSHAMIPEDVILVPLFPWTNCHQAGKSMKKSINMQVIFSNDSRHTSTMGLLITNLHTTGAIPSGGEWAGSVSGDSQREEQCG